MGRGRGRGEVRVWARTRLKAGEGGRTRQLLLLMPPAAATWHAAGRLTVRGSSTHKPTALAVDAQATRILHPVSGGRSSGGGSSSGKGGRTEGSVGAAVAASPDTVDGRGMRRSGKCAGRCCCACHGASTPWWKIAIMSIDSEWG